MGARLAGVVPPVPEVDEVPEVGPAAEAAEVVEVAEVRERDDVLASGPAASAPSGSGPAAPAEPAAAPAGMRATTTGPNTTSLAAAAMVGAGRPALLSVQAGYNLPTPDPFARNRQKVGRSFGEAVVGDGMLVLRLRRKRVGLFVPPVQVRPDQVERAAPTESDFMGNNRGVVLVRQDGEHLYIWVDEPAALLEVLAAQGFAVGADPVPVTRAG